MGQKQKSQKKKFIRGLVGWWVVVSVCWLVGWPKGIGIGHIWDFFPPEPTIVFLDGMEKSDLDDINNKCSIFNVNTLRC